MYQIIIENALAYHIEVISVEDVDQLNVYSASQKGMEKCCQILKREKSVCFNRCDAFTRY